MEDSGQFCPGHFSPSLESRCLFNRRLGGPGFVLEDSKIKIFIFPARILTPDGPALGLVAVPTAVFRFCPKKLRYERTEYFNFEI